MQIDVFIARNVIIAIKFTEVREALRTTMAGLIDSAVVHAAKKLGYMSVKPEQLQIVTSVVRGRDVFCVLPTGFGKSLCFMLLPYVYDELHVYPDGKPSIVLVVTPLTAIINDQVICCQGSV